MKKKKGNFPAASHAQRLIRADGIDAVPLLHAILQLFPIDNYVDDHAVVMEVVKGDTTPNPPPVCIPFTFFFVEYIFISVMA
jgi:L-fucose mutarotase/ribose pyranase (RbsD/FucU family)